MDRNSIHNQVEHNSTADRSLSDSLGTGWEGQGEKSLTPADYIQYCLIAIGALLALACFVVFVWVFVKGSQARRTSRAAKMRLAFERQAAGEATRRVTGEDYLVGVGKGA